MIAKLTALISVMKSVAPVEMTNLHAPMAYNVYPNHTHAITCTIVSTTVTNLLTAPVILNMNLNVIAEDASMARGFVMEKKTAWMEAMKACAPQKNLVLKVCLYTGLEGENIELSYHTTINTQNVLVSVSNRRCHFTKGGAE